MSHSYKLEYGEDTIEMQKDSLFPGERVLIMDDLIGNDFEKNNIYSDWWDSRCCC